jgi:hypothetical protein
MTYNKGRINGSKRLQKAGLANNKKQWVATFNLPPSFTKEEEIVEKDPLNSLLYHKKKLFIKSIIIIPLLLVALYFQFYIGFNKVIQADKSVNPRATDYFSHAMLVNMGEMLVHDFLFIDYDSFLFKPLHALQDYLFNEGKKYVASDNLAEEGVWWSLIQLNKYGLVKSGRPDRSLIMKELYNKKSLPMRVQALEYFYAVVDTGVKGIDFGGKEFSAAYGLFVFSFHNISYTYPGKTRDEQKENFWAAIAFGKDH